MQFATDNSNQTPASFYPRVTGTHGHAHYTLDHAVGTITQVENRSFDKAFDGNSHYPLPSEVSDGVIGFREEDAMLIIVSDCQPYAEGEDPDGNSGTRPSPLESGCSL